MRLGLYSVVNWPQSLDLDPVNWNTLVAVGTVHALPTHRVTSWVYLAEEDYVQEGLPVSEHYMQHIRRGHAILGLADDPSDGLGRCA